MRILRLSSFALSAGLLLYLVVNLGLAWLYVSDLTHPECVASPAVIQDVVRPEEHTLLTADGLRIRSWYYPPQNGTVIIALGGPTGSLGQTLPAVNFLLRTGFGVLQIDSRACAEPPAAVTLGANELMDAEAALTFLRSRPEIRNMGVIGFSMGGVTAIRAAARHPEIAAVAAEGGYFNLGKDFVEPEQSKPVYLSLFLHTIAGSVPAPKPDQSLGNQPGRRSAADQPATSLADIRRIRAAGWSRRPPARSCPGAKGVMDRSGRRTWHELPDRDTRI